MALVDYSMRLSNKEVAWFNTYDDLFEHFVDTDSFDISDNTADPSSSDDLGNFFDISGPLNGGGSDPAGACIAKL